MIQKIVDKIVTKQIENKTILEEESNIYRYGYFLMFEVIINIILSIVIGAIFKDIKTVVVFLLVYIPLRTYSGGWHANKLWKCTIISNLIVVGVEFFANYLTRYIIVTHIISMVPICMILIFAISPVDMESKPLSEDEKKVYRKKVSKIMVIHIFILAVFVLLKSKKSIIVFEYTYLLQVLMLIIEKIRRKDIRKKDDIR